MHVLPHPPHFSIAGQHRVTPRTSCCAWPSNANTMIRAPPIPVTPPAAMQSAAAVETAHVATPSHDPADTRPSSRMTVQSADQARQACEVPSTMHEALVVFASHTTPRIIVAGLASLLAWRASMPFCLADLAVTGCVAVFWVTQEYFLHAKALHSDFAWFGRDIHTAHHMKPFYHVSLDGPDLVLGMMAVSFMLFWMLFRGSPQAITATATYYTCGLLYEYTHYIVHTRVVPSTAWARCVRDNHVKHHMRNEDYWFAFTTPVLDSWLGTAPHPSAVKVSELARNTRGA